jgi:UDP-N-acetylglucosamine--N-acetylmuramyl-(pentapeptide) pyrophosphoryl-undecaprenol N-acetylglucosamine transferase
MKNVDMVFVGGGSGGHITPLVAVADAAKAVDAKASIVHIGHKGDHFNDITREAKSIDEVYEIHAGKFRRYHTETLIKKLLDVKTNALNIRDFFRFMRGAYQAWRLLGKLQPKVIFMKGGYVCAGVGMAAKVRKIPYVTHDSDAMVSLAHRIIADDATKHLTALPAHYYPQYDQAKTEQVGVPVSASFKRVGAAERQAAKKKLGLPEKSLFILVTGGGLGGQIINRAVLRQAEALLKAPTTYMTLVSGKKNYTSVLADYDALSEHIKERLIIEPFTREMHTLSAAADLIVTRAGMTAITEFGLQAKACLVVPNPLLAGGHQLKNAAALSDVDAVEVISEKDIDVLVERVNALLSNNERRRVLGDSLHEHTIPNAAEKIVTQLYQAMKD